MRIMRKDVRDRTIERAA